MSASSVRTTRTATRPLSVEISGAFFASYLESFQVPTTSNSFNELLPNREGVSLETGVKINLYDRKVTGTLSYFETTDQNRAVSDSSAYNVYTRDINGNGPRDPGFDPNNLAPNTPMGDTVAARTAGDGLRHIRRRRRDRGPESQR